jgi:hypothetical protein
MPQSNASTNAAARCGDLECLGTWAKKGFKGEKS